MLAGLITPVAMAQAPISCTEMVDAASGKRLIHEGQCDVRVTPASTFKIALGLMGFDSGILKDEHSPTLPFKEGYVDWLPEWRANIDPQTWMKHSVVWYSQQIASKLRAERFQQYVTSFNYGNQNVAGDAGKDNGLSRSWINSSLKISPVEQVAFLRNVVNRKLPLKAPAYDMTFRILKNPTLPNGWEVYGKTGSGSPVLTDGRSDPAWAYGWFVGWAVKGDRTVVFARLVQEPKQASGGAGLRVRDAFLRDLPAQLDPL